MIPKSGVSPGAILPRDMDARQWATWISAQGIQGSRSVRSFTPEWFGFATPPTGELKYIDFGTIVVMWAEAPLVATSTSTDLGITNVPDEIDPGGLTAHCVTLDNGDAWSSVARLGNVPNEIEFELLEVVGSKILASGADYTGSGSKGLPAGWLIVYPKS